MCIVQGKTDSCICQCLPISCPKGRPRIKYIVPHVWQKISHASSIFSLWKGWLQRRSGWFKNISLWPNSEILTLIANNADSPVHLSPRRPPLEVSWAPSFQMVQISINSSKMFQQARMALGSSDGTGLSRCHCCYTSLLWVMYHNHCNVRLSCFFQDTFNRPLLHMILLIFFYTHFILQHCSIHINSGQGWIGPAVPGWPW